LDIEERLVLIYNRDFIFYLSKPAAQYKEILEKALKQAKKSGLIDKLIHQYRVRDFNTLHLDKLIQIRLKIPK
jgi:hypothetical protein